MKTLLALLGIFVASLCQAQSDADKDSLKDTIRDSSSLPDSTAIDSLYQVKDSIPPSMVFFPLKSHYSLSEHISPSISIKKSDLTFLTGGDVNEIIADYRGTYPAYPGNWAMNASSRIYGTLPNGQSAGVNGMQLFTVDNQSNHINFFPIEHFEELEIYTGSKAAILAENSQVFINYQFREFNTATPYTQLSYFDAGNSFISGEGLFSQNILPNQNLTLGFKSFGGGTEYEGQIHDAMNIFLSYRYNISDLSSLSLNYSYINSFVRDNGGVALSDLTQPYRDNDQLEESTADLRYPGYYYRELGHIIQANYSQLFDSDSTIRYNANLSYHYSDYSPFELDTSRLNPFPVTPIVSTRQVLSFDLRDIVVTTGADARGSIGANKEQYQYGLSPFGYVNTQLSNFEFSCGVRANISSLYTNIDFGGRVAYKIDSLFDLWIDYSNKNIVQLNPYSLIPSYTVSSFIGGGELNLSRESKLSLSSWLHSYSQVPTLAGVVNDVSSIGGQVRFISPLTSNFIFDNFDLNYDISASVEKFSSLEHLSLDSYIDLYAEYMVSKSVARLGAIGRFLSNTHPFYFDSYTQQYTLANYTPQESLILDAYVMAKLGNANIRLLMENILSERFLPLLPYPNRGRNFWIHLSWAFPYN